MVESTGVRGSTLARLAMVLVWQRAVNRQPGSRARTRRAGTRASLGGQGLVPPEYFRAS